MGDGCMRLRWHASYQFYAMKSTLALAHPLWARAQVWLYRLAPPCYNPSYQPRAGVRNGAERLRIHKG